MGKERPILFSGPMVDAIQKTRKTQTRRVIKPQPYTNCVRVVPFGDEFLQELTGKDDAGEDITFHLANINQRLKCPYGKRGDHLWVKETHYLYGRWVQNGVKKNGKPAYRFVPEIKEAMYPDNPPAVIAGRAEMYSGETGWFKRPSIHMPRWASRILLEITGVRVERLQAITEEDAQAEGAPEVCNFCGNHPEDEAHWVCEEDYDPEPYHREGFKRLWQSINGADSWERNDWVWVIEFRRVSE